MSYRHHRTAVITGALAGLILLLAGCGGGDKSVSPDASIAAPPAPPAAPVTQNYCGTFTATGEMAAMLRVFQPDASCTPVADGQGSGVIRYVGLGDVADAVTVPGEKTGSYVIRVSAFTDMKPHPLPAPAKLKVDGRRIGAGEEVKLSTPETTILAMTRSPIPSEPTRNFTCVLAAKRSATAPQLRILLCREIPAADKDAAARDVAHQMIQRLLPQITALPLKNAG